MLSPGRKFKKGSLTPVVLGRGGTYGQSAYMSPGVSRAPKLHVRTKSQVATYTLPSRGGHMCAESGLAKHLSSGPDGCPILAPTGSQEHTLHELLSSATARALEGTQ